MKKDIRVSVRVSSVMLAFVKEKAGLESDGAVVDYLLSKYWGLYHVEENPFGAGVPKNEVTKEKKDEKIKIQSVQGKPKDKADVLVIGDKEDGGEVDAGIVTKMDKGRPVKGRYDENGLFKRL